MTIRVGIIGLGKIAQVRHIPEYLANPDAELYGFFDLNFERAKELADKYNGKAYETYQDMLADPTIEAISVCTANHVHAEITVAALKAGKHVLCEKPMAVTPEECEEMVATAKATGKYLMIGQNQRLAKAHTMAKELIAKGEIGKVLTFRTIFGHGGPETWSIDPGKNTWFFDKKKAAMGAMADLGIHKTDMIQYILGERIVKTQAAITTLDKRDATGNLIGVDDNAICIYTMESGAIGTMTASWTYYTAENNSTTIYGSEGMLRLYDDADYSVRLYKNDGTHFEYSPDQIQTNDNQTSSGIIDLFMKSLTEHTPPEISGEDVIHAMRAVFASIESAKTGRAVEVQ